jgi:hypothetical protein
MSCRRAFGKPFTIHPPRARKEGQLHKEFVMDMARETSKAINVWQEANEE